MATTNLRRTTMKTKSCLTYSMAFLLFGLCLGAEEWLTEEAFADARRRYNSMWTYPQDATASNVYMQVRQLYGGNGRTLFDHFLGVRGGGVAQEMEMQDFMPFVHFVSNHCAEIAANWQIYETNEVVRFTTLSAVGCSGFDNYTNFVDMVLCQYETGTNSCSWSTVKFMKSPYGTEEEVSLELKYDIPFVSNILLRVRSAAMKIGDDTVRQSCEFELSGNGRRNYLEMKAAGAL